MPKTKLYNVTLTKNHILRLRDLIVKCGNTTDRMGVGQRLKKALK